MIWNCVCDHWNLVWHFGLLSLVFHIVSCCLVPRALVTFVHNLFRNYGLVTVASLVCATEKHKFVLANFSIEINTGRFEHVTSFEGHGFGDLDITRLR